MARTIPTESETFIELGKRSTEELISFRDKLKRIDTPRSWELRLFIIRLLLGRELAGAPELDWELPT